MNWPWFLATFILSSPTLAAASMQFSVQCEAVKGPVFFRTPQSVEWTPVTSGQTIREDSLIHILDGGAIKLKYRRSEQARLRQYQLTLSEPNVVRITPHMVRRISLSEVYLKRHKKEHESKSEEQDILPFRSAWKRFSAVFDRTVANVKSIFGAQEHFEDGNLAKSVKKLQLISPVDQQNILKTPTAPATASATQ